MTSKKRTYENPTTNDPPAKKTREEGLGQTTTTARPVEQAVSQEWLLKALETILPKALSQYRPEPHAPDSAGRRYEDRGPAATYPDPDPYDTHPSPEKRETLKHNTERQPRSHH